jgi:hypothetical protein
VDRAELLDREVAHERGDGAVPFEVAAQRCRIARRRDDVAARQDVAVGMDDEAAARPARAGRDGCLFRRHVPRREVVAGGA